MFMNRVILQKHLWGNYVDMDWMISDMKKESVIFKRKVLWRIWDEYWYNCSLKS